jgi:hypothetical protein
MEKYLGKMLGKEVKLELENVYEKYCWNDLGVGDDSRMDRDEWSKMLEKFVDFRLYVSGGRYGCSMGSVGCESVSGFLNEIFLFDNMMCDWGGCYRGDFSYECLDGLIELLNESSLSDDIKEMIVSGYKEENGLNDDEE